MFRRGLPIYFFRHFCCSIYRVAANGEADEQKSRLQFETKLVNTHADNVYFRQYGRLVYRTSYAVQSAITVTAELLIRFIESNQRKRMPTSSLSVQGP